MPEFTTQHALVALVLLAAVAQLYWVFKKGRGPLGHLLMKHRVLARGEAAEATVLEQWDTAIRLQKRPLLGLRLEVRRDGHAPYEARTWTTVAHRLTTDWVAAGQRVHVKVDPDHPQRVFVVGPLLVPAPAPPPADPVKAMEDLRRLADAGLITSDEYETKRAEILSRL